MRCKVSRKRCPPGYIPRMGICFFNGEEYYEQIFRFMEVVLRK